VHLGPRPPARPSARQPLTDFRRLTGPRGRSPTPRPAVTLRLQLPALARPAGPQCCSVPPTPSGSAILTFCIIP
jgi:hypothetical protein